MAMQTIIKCPREMPGKGEELSVIVVSEVRPRGQERRRDQTPPIDSV